MNVKDLADVLDLIYNYEQSIIIITDILSYLYLIIPPVYIDINVLKTIQPYSKFKKTFIIINILIITSVIIF